MATSKRDSLRLVVLKLRWKKTVKETTRVNLLSNSVLIAPKTSLIDKVTIEPGFDLAKLAGDGKIVTGDVKAVPVGRYAKSALEKLGAWSAVESQFVRAENVRAALLLVARNEAALGIVYATDAKIGTRREDCRHFPGELASADHLSVRSDDHSESRSR